MAPEHSVSHVIRFFFIFLTLEDGIYTDRQHVRLGSGEQADMTECNQVWQTNEAHA